MTDEENWAMTENNLLPKTVSTGTEKMKKIEDELAGALTDYDVMTNRKWGMELENMDTERNEDLNEENNRVLGIKLINASDSEQEEEKLQ